ncbi:MAG: hypothetical protein JWO45_114 [Spartobacteria bacterium]|nr:hypothetical protein [Spartobacteria bacterium]
MPMPVVEPIPVEPLEWRRVVPLLAQEASYFCSIGKDCEFRLQFHKDPEDTIKPLSV